MGDQILWDRMFNMNQQMINATQKCIEILAEIREYEITKAQEMKVVDLQEKLFSCFIRLIWMISWVFATWIKLGTSFFKRGRMIWIKKLLFLSF